ncbi:hypothetical protein EYZ11_012964 [Aspergillus tanneri]|uniref:Uncharacterized protein n=1 Tax=Aspergillus tanneri TaxID=1220188 RepID=A0A4S3J112_9EURO|nr:hypothetical protein EYZ11_012964 [Aspergillus tanneri]
MEELDNRPGLPLDDTQGKLFDGLKEMQAELQPTQPKKTTLALDSEIYKKLMQLNFTNGKVMTGLLEFTCVAAEYIRKIRPNGAV